MTKFRLPIGSQRSRTGDIAGYPDDWKNVNGYNKGPYFLKDGTAMGYHSGIDLFNGAPGDPVYSIGDGIVIYSNEIKDQSWGNLIVIDHGKVDKGFLYSRYGHLASRSVQNGAHVTHETIIGFVGSGPARYNMDPHLHFDISTTRILFDDPDNWPFETNLVMKHYVNPRDWLKQEHEVEGVADGGPNIEYTITAFGTKLRKDIFKAEEIPLEPDFRLPLPTKLNVYLVDHHYWQQIQQPDHPFNNWWVIVSDEDQNPKYIKKSPK